MYKFFLLSYISRGKLTYCFFAKKNLENDTLPANHTPSVCLIGTYAYGQHEPDTNLYTPVNLSLQWNVQKIFSKCIRHIKSFLYVYP